jgi:O-antigen/teichoic acid export membrane protein
LAALIIYCYIGPGLDGGVIAAVLGFFASIFLAFVAIIWYPIKQVIKKFKRKSAGEDTVD